jgi:hypothetical protein
MGTSIHRPEGLEFFKPGEFFYDIPFHLTQNGLKPRFWVAGIWKKPKGLGYIMGFNQENLLNISLSLFCISHFIFQTNLSPPAATAKKY